MACDDATFDAILAKLADHGNLSRALRDSECSNGSFYRRVDGDEADAERYARAKSIGLRALAAEIIDIADDGRNDTYTDDDGNQRPDNEYMQRSKLRIEARKFLLAKLLPKVYGDKLTLAGDADNPIAFVDHTAVASKLLPELAAGDTTKPPGGTDEA